MKAGKEIQTQARRLFRACVKDGSLNEDAVRRVSSVLLEKKPRGYFSLLKTFTGLVKGYVASKTAVVTGAVELTETERRLITEKLNARYGQELQYEWHTDSSLIAGIIVRVGDEVTDGTVRQRLSSLFSQNNKLLSNQ